MLPIIRAVPARRKNQSSRKKTLQIFGACGEKTKNARETFVETISRAFLFKWSG